MNNKMLRRPNKEKLVIDNYHSQLNPLLTGA